MKFQWNQDETASLIEWIVGQNRFLMLKYCKEKKVICEESLSPKPRREVSYKRLLVVIYNCSKWYVTESISAQPRRVLKKK